MSRQSHEQPSAVTTHGWRYHHLGIPTTTPHPGEQHLEALKVHVCGFETSRFGVEWMRFEEGCQVPDLVRAVPHIAFEVDDLDKALIGQEIIIQPNSPSDGVRVAFIVENGAPVELMEFPPSSAGPTDHSG